MIWKVDLESLAMATQLRAKIPYGAVERIGMVREAKQANAVHDSTMS